MALIKNLLIKNNQYNDVRMTISGEEGSDTVNYYTEASGDRYYYTKISATASPVMEAATFNSFFSTETTGAQSHKYKLVPMFDGDSCLMEVKVVCINITGTSGYYGISRGMFIKSSGSIRSVGSGMIVDSETDFIGVNISFTYVGNQFIFLTLNGITGETIDWDVHINYTKGFHTLAGGGSLPPSNPIYPSL